MSGKRPAGKPASYKPSAGERFYRASKRDLQRSILMYRQLRSKLEKAFPKLPIKLLAGVADDLTDIWLAGQKHTIYLRRILSPRCNRDIVERALIGFEISAGMEQASHIRKLKKRLPILLSGLVRQERNEQRRKIRRKT